MGSLFVKQIPLLLKKSKENDAAKLLNILYYKTCIYGNQRARTWNWKYYSRGSSSKKRYWEIGKIDFDTIM